MSVGTVAFLGLPGAGKTTTAKLLAARWKCDYRLEPEEHDWPESVLYPGSYGDFTRMTWFRSQRVPSYFQAADAKAAGQRFVIDSYYDKLSGLWLEDSSMRWLFDPTDPYFPVAQRFTELDRRLLPAVDILVMLIVSEEVWKTRLAKRGRGIDSDEAFRSSYSMQAVMLRAARHQTAADGTTLLTVDANAQSPTAVLTSVTQAIAAAAAA